MLYHYTAEADASEHLKLLTAVLSLVEDELGRELSEHSSQVEAVEQWLFAKLFLKALILDVEGGENQ